MSKLIKIFKAALLFFIASLPVKLLMGDWENKALLEKFLLAIPLLLLLVDLMRLIELIIAFGFSKKEMSIVSLEGKKINNLLDRLNINIVFINIHIGDEYIIARKVGFGNNSEPVSSVRIYKSLISERYYAADKALFMLLLSKVILFNVIIVLVKICFFIF